jgi:hypothetical protein
MVDVTPIYGWGFQETIDGELAPTFQVEILEDGFEFAPDVIGWKAISLNGKYAGRNVRMTPRHVEWTEVVALTVYEDNDADGYVFYGMANTKGLECSWK